jgi:hypothetical protein
MPVSGLRAADLTDIVSLDRDALYNIRLDELLAIMRRCGVSTVGIQTVEAAATRLIERGKIILGDN